MSKKLKSEEKCAWSNNKGFCLNEDHSGVSCCHCNDFIPETHDTDEKQEARPMRTNRPRFLEVKVIATCLLEKHPDAEAFGADADDRTALASSVADIGLLDPISVAVDGDFYLVVDGCGRLDALRAAGVDEALCLVFDLGGMSPREFAMQRNTMQRKVTTGQRLLCYLSVNRGDVLKAAKDGEKQADGRGNQGGRGNPRSRDRGFYSRDISERLGVSDKDVRAAVDLLRQEAEPTPEDADEEDAEKAQAAIKDVWNRVMAGVLPVRRWRPAFEGLRKTAGTERKPTDYSKLATTALTSLRSVFAHWQEIPVEAYPVLLASLRDVLKTAPEAAEGPLADAHEALREARIFKTKRLKPTK